MKLERNDTLLMIGDSITDFGRKRPVGEGLHEGVGTGYPMYVRAFLESMYPELNVHVINMGTSGDNIRALKSRWKTDVFDLRPDWVSVMIGVNDVWRQFDQPGIPESHVYLPEFESTLDEQVTSTLPRVKGMILMTPYYMEPCREDRMRAVVDTYGAAVKRVAEKRGALFVDTQAAFDKLFEHMHSSNVAWDRVHPNYTGHMLLARALLRALEFDFNKEL
ncbi:MAG: SGNH/GDSL hydrolase family protein [Clostridia bacterium]|nr:SGNH/GDSL hydrolase family protein [Clostridia bacterium]